MTIKDVAREAGVSASAVHMVLAGKPGIKAETADRVRAVAARLGYRPNSAAASLSRKTLYIAAALPYPTAENSRYDCFYWQGVRTFAALARDWNIELIEVPYHTEAGGAVNSQSDELERALSTHTIDGVLTVAHTHAGGEICIRRVTERGIPTVLISSDLPASKRLCCVMPDYRMIGRSMAELLSLRLPQNGSVLICAGDILLPSNYLVADGIEAYLAENRPDVRAVRLSSHYDSERDSSEMRRTLTEQHIDGCAAVNARGTVQLGGVLQSLHLAGSLPAVGSDLFAETIALLKNGTYMGLVYKRPYDQAYYGMQYLTGFIRQKEMPPAEVVNTGMELVLRSGADMYDNSAFRLLL